VGKRKRNRQPARSGPSPILPGLPGASPTPLSTKRGSLRGATIRASLPEDVQQRLDSHPRISDEGVERAWDAGAGKVFRPS
jgi:hypothetical protein